MERPHLRPIYDRTVPGTPSDLHAQLERALRQDDRVKLRISSGHVQIDIGDDDAHFWSPFADIELRPQDAALHLKGRIGPRAAVWTLYFAIYASVFFLTMASMVYGSVQWLLDEPPLCWVALMGSIVGVIVTYATAWAGRQRAEGQIVLLREVLDQALDTSEPA